MSTRNPTGHAGYKDESLLYNRQRIVTATPTSVANDQVWILDAPQMILSDCFVPWRTATNGSYQTIKTVKVMLKNMADVLPAATTVNCSWAMLAWAGSASITEFALRITDGTTASTQTINANLTDKLWRSTGTPQWATGSAVTLTLSAQVTGGSDPARFIYVAGIYLQCDES